MFDADGRTPSEVLHVAVDLMIAAVAGGLVLLVFYPLTLGATALKSLFTVPRHGHGTRLGRSSR